jgi:hypothetical protein
LEIASGRFQPVACRAAHNGATARNENGDQRG